MSDRGAPDVNSWNSELFDKVYGFWSLQLYNRSRDLGLREGLRQLLFEIDNHDIEARELYSQVELVVKCVVYLEHALIDTSTLIQEYERVYRFGLSNLSKYAVSPQPTHKMHYVYTWFYLFEAKIDYYYGQFQRSYDKIALAKDSLKVRNPHVLNAIDYDATKVAMRIYGADYVRIATFDQTHQLHRLYSSLSQLMSLEIARILNDHGLKHVEDFNKLHTWVLQDYNWSYLFYKKRDSDLRGLVKELLNTREFKRPKYYLQTYLHLLAHHDVKNLVKMPKLDTIRRFESESVKNGGAQNCLFDFLSKLFKAEENLKNKCLTRESLVELSQKVEVLPTLEEEVLALSVLARKAKAWGHSNLLLEFQHKYKLKCELATSGKSKDVLGVLIDEPPPSLLLTKKLLEREDKNYVSEIKTSTSSRVTNLAKVATELALLRVKGSIKRSISSGSKRVKAQREEQKRISEVLVDALGELKGPYMKMGQLISTIALDLSPVMEDEMRKLLDSAIPMDPMVIRKVVESELGQPLEDVFDSWNQRPLAAASIGQLHRAALKTGEEVVVKVQYPNIEKTLTEDAKAINLLVPLYKVLFPSAEIRKLMDETNRRLLDETDYTKEIRYQNLAHEICQSFEGVYVPKVFEAYSTSKVITMEYVEGQDFFSFLQTSKQEEINIACSRIIKFFLKSYFKHGLVNGDPHPGNFIFMPNGDVCIVDYGFADIVDVEWRNHWMEIVCSAVEDDFEGFETHLRKVGLVADESFDLKFAFNNVKSILEYGKDEAVLIDANWARDFVQSITIGSVNRKFVNLDSKDIVTSRFLICLQSILIKMQPYMMLGRIYREAIYETKAEIEEENKQKGA